MHDTHWRIYLTREITKRMIRIPFIKEGIHRYPAASIDPSLEDVKYLGNEHFHYFYFYVSIEVFHNDRCIEFQQFKRYCESLYKEQLTLDYKSCEMIAEELIYVISQKYPARDIDVEVYEDNINGCKLSWRDV